jgi:hypothetical protein
VSLTVSISMAWFADFNQFQIAHYLSQMQFVRSLFGWCLGDCPQPGTQGGNLAGAVSEDSEPKSEPCLSSITQKLLIDLVTIPIQIVLPPISIRYLTQRGGSGFQDSELWCEECSEFWATELESLSTVLVFASKQMLGFMVAIEMNGGIRQWLPTRSPPQLGRASFLCSATSSMMVKLVSLFDHATLPPLCCMLNWNWAHCQNKRDGSNLTCFVYRNTTQTTKGWWLADNLQPLLQSVMAPREFVQWAINNWYDAIPMLRRIASALMQKAGALRISQVYLAWLWRGAWSAARWRGLYEAGSCSYGTMSRSRSCQIGRVVVVTV